MQLISRVLKVISILAVLTLFSQCQKPETISEKDKEFREILSEDNFNEWEGNPDYWQFEDGVLTGEITPENILIEHSFFIWKGEIVNDFELKAEYRITPRGNSGISYRSKEVEDKEFVLRGYQADIDGENEYTGQIYGDKGGAFLTHRSQFTHMSEANEPKEIGKVGEESELLSFINKDDEWNKYHLVVKGNVHVLMINGRVMSMAIDDGKNQTKEGLLGLQLHLGPPMKVEFRNLQIKNISS